MQNPNKSPKEYILERSKLKPGDIILTSESTLQSKFIRTGTKSDFSHAMLYVDDDIIIHSDSEGVHPVNPQRLLLHTIQSAKVLRPKISDEIIKQACVYPRQVIGGMYSYFEAALTKLPIKQPSELQFCSRLVARAYHYAGVNLVKNPDYCVPEDLNKSTLLIPVENCVRKASSEEINFANSESPLDKQKNITNEILKDIRKLTKTNIQSFSDLSNHLLRHSKDDSAICEIIEKSGYLYMWKWDEENNPWRYDKFKFVVHIRDLGMGFHHIKQLTTDEIRSATKELERRHAELNMLLPYSIKFKRQYFDQQIALLKTLIDRAELRLDAAQQAYNLFKPQLDLIDKISSNK